MVQVPNLADIVKKNPALDPEELRLASLQLQEFRQRGLRRRRYHLALPHARQRARPGLTDADDPRTVNLSACRYGATLAPKKSQD